MGNISERLLGEEKAERYQQLGILNNFGRGESERPPVPRQTGLREGDESARKRGRGRASMIKKMLGRKEGASPAAGRQQGRKLGVRQTASVACS